LTDQSVIPQPAPARRRKQRSKGTGIPYASATSGARAREETIKWLRRLGCEEIGFMDKFEQHELLLYFKHRGRSIQLTVSAKGWAQKYLKENPYTYRMRRTRTDYEQEILRQDHIVANSVLRDHAKASVTAIESGILSFEAIFTPHMLTNDGRPLIERVNDLLPKPDEPKIVALPAR
jgi:hypothetical protein